VHFTYVIFLHKESLKYSMIYYLQFFFVPFFLPFLSKECVDFLPNILPLSPSVLLLLHVETSKVVFSL
jgi:hypothetical protein